LKKYIYKWTYKRLIQLFVGLFLIYYSTQDSNLFAKIFGVIMTGQALLNIGCFSTRGCETPFEKKKQEDFSKEIKKINKEN
jgi:hypothetical protein